MLTKVTGSDDQKKKRRAKDSSGNSDSDRIDDSPTHPLYPYMVIVVVVVVGCSCTSTVSTLKSGVPLCYLFLFSHFLLSFSRPSFNPVVLGIPIAAAAVIS